MDYELELIYEGIVVRRLSIRKLSKEIGIPKSTIHYRIHNQIKRRSNSFDYSRITRQLFINSHPRVTKFIDY